MLRLRLALTPNIVVYPGTVENWAIENRSDEPHAFHINQLHFQPRQASGPGKLSL
jgi:FtsP/CotA-like multicopper oxidase with cupredoxin domain